jgi:hypothetical protein
MVIIALCVSLTFDVPYTEVVHSVGYGVFSFFAVIALPMITGREVYEYMEEKGY